MHICHLMTNFNEYVDKLQNHVLHTIKICILKKPQSYVLLLTRAIDYSTDVEILHCHLAF